MLHSKFFIKSRISFTKCWFFLILGMTLFIYSQAFWEYEALKEVVRIACIIVLLTPMIYLVPILILIGAILGLIVYVFRKEYIDKYYIRINTSVEYEESLSIVTINSEIYNATPSISEKTTLLKIKYNYDALTVFNIHEIKSFVNVFANKYKYTIIKKFRPYFFVIRYLPELLIIAITLLFIATYASVFAIINNKIALKQIDFGIIAINPGTAFFLLLIVVIISLLVKIRTFNYLVREMITEYKMMKYFFENIFLEMKMQEVIKFENTYASSIKKFLMGIFS